MSPPAGDPPRQPGGAGAAAEPAAGGLGVRFWVIAVASGVSRLGTLVLRLAVPWAMLQTRDSPVLALLSLGIQAAPYVVAPVLGSVIDRFDRRRLYVGAELLQAATVAAIPLFMHLDRYPVVFLLLMVAGVGEVLSYLTTDYGIIPALVGPERLNVANSRYFMLLHGGTIGGPVVAGGLIALVGVEAAIYLNAATYLFTAGAGLLLPSLVAASQSRVEGLRAAFRWLRGRRDLTRLTAALTVFNLGSGTLFAIVLVTAGDLWGWGSEHVGVALTAGAVATAVGALAAGRVRAQASLERRILGWLGVAAAGAAVMLPGYAVPAVVVGGYCLTVFGIGGMNVVSQTYRQLGVPSDLTGRVNALIRTAVLGSIPLSAVVVAGVISIPVAALRFVPALLGCAGAVLLWAPVARRTAPSPELTGDGA